MEKIPVLLKSDINASTLYTGLCTVIIPRLVLLRMRNVSDEIYRENQNTHFTYNIFFFLNRAVLEIMCKNMAQTDRPHMT